MKEEEDILELPNIEGIFIQAYDLVETLTKEELGSLARTPPAKALLLERKAAKETTNSGKCMPSPPRAYKIGDHVRATYYVDGIDYEATIVDINTEAGTCTVRFIGYDNEEEVQINNLVASWGKKTRRQQVATAKANEEKPEKDSHAPKYRNRSTESRKIGNNRCFMPLPPPPIPPDFGQQLNATNAKLLSSMLVSWYMTGYYTGVYQGSMMSKEDVVNKAVPQPKSRSNATKKTQSK